MPFFDVDINETVSDDFLEYAGHVMQERAIPDARDCLKDGARKILFSQYKSKNTHDRVFIKGAAAAAEALKNGYIHGDAAAYGVLVRMGKPYAFPYTFEEFQGNGGNQVSPDNHAHGRYLELRQTELAKYLFEGIDKNSIDEWYWNYSNTMELPRVLPTIGFYPIVNGSNGISVGLSTSIPSTNLREVNNAIIKLIKNPDIVFDEIYCAPDFPMGGTITNGDAVKESMKKGSGDAIRIRAKLEYDPDKNLITATEIPFSVYTETIDNELTDLINDEEHPCGIERYLDATNDDGARILIYLSKKANVKRVINLLYKRTSLESFYGINMIMLDNGRFPKVFSWREALLAYIAHIRVCKFKEIEYDLLRAKERLNIVDGLLIATNNMNQVVQIIRQADNVTDASNQLSKQFNFNEEQVKSVLAMRLSALTKLDANKLIIEKNDLLVKINEYNHLLNTPIDLDKELIKILEEVATKYGRDRKTEILNISTADDELEDTSEEKQLSVFLFSDNSIKVQQIAELPAAKRGQKGKPIHAQKGVALRDTIYCTNHSTLAAFTSEGKIYTFTLRDVEENAEVSLYSVISLQSSETILFLVDMSKMTNYRWLLMVTKNGYVKKSKISEYQNIRGKTGTIAIKLEDDDEVVNAFMSANEKDKLMIATDRGYYNLYSHDCINAIGRVARGVKGIKLQDSYVVSAILIRESLKYKGILAINNNGRGKMTVLSEYNDTTKVTKGLQISKLNNDEKLGAISAILETQDKVLIACDKKFVNLNLNVVPVQNRTTMGVNLIDAKQSNSKIIIM